MRSRSIAKRVFSIVPTLFGVSLLIFLLVKLSPGDVSGLVAGERASKDVIDQYRKKFRLDEPFIKGYAVYLSSLLRGDLGESYYTGEKVFHSLMQKLPNTLLLASLSMLVGTLLGIAFGALAAVWKGSLLDKALHAVSIFFISTPVFWTAIVLMFVFSMVLCWLPASALGRTDLRAYILPAFVLGSRSAGYIAQLTRASMIEALGSAYIMTACSKGLARARVVIFHALRNSLVPVITLVGIDFGSYLNGSVLTESVFGIDGVGRYAITAILKRDIPVIMGTVIAGALIFILVNLAVDLLCFRLDPRMGAE